MAHSMTDATHLVVFFENDRLYIRFTLFLLLSGCPQNGHLVHQFYLAMVQEFFYCNFMVPMMHLHQSVPYSNLRQVTKDQITLCIIVSALLFHLLAQQLQFIQYHTFTLISRLNCLCFIRVR